MYKLCKSIYDTSICKEVIMSYSQGQVKPNFSLIYKTIHIRILSVSLILTFHLPATQFLFISATFAHLWATNN